MQSILSFRAFIPTGSIPNYAIFGHDGGTIYVSNTGNGTVSEVDIVKGFVKRNILAGEGPEHIVLSRDGSMLYAVDADAGKVNEIDLSTGATLRSFKIGGELHGMDLSEDGATLFVSGKDENKIVAVDLASGSMRTAALGPAPYHQTMVTGVGKIYVSSRDEPKVWIVDPVTLKAMAEIPIEDEGHQMVVLPSLSPPNRGDDHDTDKLHNHCDCGSYSFAICSAHQRARQRFSHVE